MVLPISWPIKGLFVIADRMIPNIQRQYAGTNHKAPRTRTRKGQAICPHGTYGQRRAAVHGAVLRYAVFVGVGLEKPRPVLKEKTPAWPEFFLLIFLLLEISA